MKQPRKSARLITTALAPKREIAGRHDELAAIDEAIRAGRLRRVPSGLEMGAVYDQIPTFVTVKEAQRWLRLKGCKVRTKGATTWIDGVGIPNARLLEHSRLIARNVLVKEWQERQAS